MHGGIYNRVIYSVNRIFFRFLPIISMVIFLKKQSAKITVLCITIAICIFLFAGFGWIYLKLNSTAQLKNASVSETEIPYFSVPRNTSVLYIFSNKSTALLILDFAEKKLTAVLNPDSSIDYDYTLQPLSGTSDGFIDRLGGLELEQNGKIFRYTGSQAVKLLANGAINEEPLLRAVFNRIAVLGLTRSQMTFLLQNSKTELTVPICYSWPEWLCELCANAEIIINEVDLN